MSDARAQALNWRDDPAWPDIDVVMPIRNEAAHLAAALAAVRRQDYEGTVRIYLAVGPSTDGTADVAARLAAADGAVTVLDNPTGRTPTALNLAIRSGSSPVVVRVDGHSELSDGYLQQAVDTLRRTGAANVGGRQAPIATTPFELAVAAATSSWLGTGGPSYRVGGTERIVDTVYLGVFDRGAIEAVGLFDEDLIRNQDYELNIRLRQAGGTVVFDPKLAVAYRPRGTWATLARQYFEYGHWKAVVMRKHPGSTRLRQVAPLALAVGNVGAVGLSARHPRLLFVPAIYAAALVALSPKTELSNGADPRSEARLRHRLRTALVLALIHHVWPAGLLLGSTRRLDRTC